MAMEEERIVRLENDAATKQFRLAMEIDEERKARWRRWQLPHSSGWPWRQRKKEEQGMYFLWICFGFGFDLDLIWIHIGVSKTIFFQETRYPISSSLAVRQAGKHKLSYGCKVGY